MILLPIMHVDSASRLENRMRCAVLIGISIAAAVVMSGHSLGSQPVLSLPMPASGGVQAAIRVSGLLGPSDDQRAFIENQFAPLIREDALRFREIRAKIIAQARRIPLDTGGGRLRITDSSEAEGAVAEAADLVLGYVDATIESIDAILFSDELHAILADPQRSRLGVVSSAMARRIRLDATAGIWPGARSDPILTVLSAFAEADRLTDPVVSLVVSQVARARGQELDQRARRYFETSVDAAGRGVLAISLPDRRSPEALAAREKAWTERGSAEREWVAASDRAMRDLLQVLGADPIAKAIEAAWRRERSPASMAGEDGIADELASLLASSPEDDPIRRRLRSLSSEAEDALVRMIDRERRWRAERSREFVRMATSLDSYRESMRSLRQQRADLVAVRMLAIAEANPGSEAIGAAVAWSNALRDEVSHMAILDSWPPP